MFRYTMAALFFVDYFNAGRLPSPSSPSYPPPSTPTL